MGRFGSLYVLGLLRLAALIVGAAVVVGSETVWLYVGSFFCLLVLALWIIWRRSS
jgi:hypothetical protein